MEQQLSKEQEAKYHENLRQQAEEILKSWATSVSEPTIVRRINRVLAKDGWLQVRKARPQAFANLGGYYLLDVHRNVIVDHHLDLANLAKEHKVLSLFETINAFKQSGSSPGGPHE